MSQWVYYLSESKSYFKKGSDLTDLYCNIVKVHLSKIALNQGFYRLLTCSESLFVFSKSSVDNINNKKSQT